MIVMMYIPRSLFVGVCISELGLVGDTLGRDVCLVPDSSLSIQLDGLILIHIKSPHSS